MISPLLSNLFKPAHPLTIKLFCGISTLTDLDLLQACALVVNLLLEGALSAGLKIDGTSKEIVFVDGIEYDCAKYIYPILNWDSSPLVASVTLAIRHDRSLADIF